MPKNCASFSFCEHTLYTCKPLKCINKNSGIIFNWKQFSHVLHCMIYNHALNILMRNKTVQVYNCTWGYPCCGSINHFINLILHFLVNGSQFLQNLNGILSREIKTCTCGTWEIKFTGLVLLFSRWMTHESWDKHLIINEQ